MKHNYKPPKFTDRELLEMFPESKKIINLKIDEYEDEIQKKTTEIKLVLKNIDSSEADPLSKWFAEKVLEVFILPELTELEKRVFRLKRFQFIFKPKKKYKNLIRSEEKLEIARKYPIEELARSKLELKEVGGKFVSLCPFHNEKTPSFYIYPDSNRFYCFGCQEKGDVISLTMALYNLDFKGAVEMLQN